MDFCSCCWGIRLQERQVLELPDVNKSSVLQWAGSSLKEISKKIRKSVNPDMDVSPPDKPRLAARGPRLTPRQLSATRPPETLPGVFTPAKRHPASVPQLQIQVPNVDAAYSERQKQVLSLLRHCSTARNVGKPCFRYLYIAIPAVCSAMKEQTGLFINMWSWQCPAKSGIPLGECAAWWVHCMCKLWSSICLADTWGHLFFKLCT